MRIWRISSFDDLSGVGGLKADGRWHDRGRHVVYAADHPASALLEVMVHLEIDFEDLPTSYQLLGIDVPDSLTVETVSLTDVEQASKDWADDPRVTRGLLRNWFDQARTAVVSVPSVIVPFAQNYLINPRHKDVSRIRVSHVGRYPHDPRLFGQRTDGTT